MPVALAGHRLMNEADLLFLAEATIAVVGVDDHHTAAVHIEMTQNERQRSSANRPEPDHHERSVDPSVNWPLAHDFSSARAKRRRPWEEQKAGGLVNGRGAAC